MQVTTFSPLFRHAIGLERFNDLFETMAQSSKASGDAYPPYNIEKRGENEYRITMAVAGFKPSELSIVAQDDELHISGTTAGTEPEKTEYLYKGIFSVNSALPISSKWWAQQLPMACSPLIYCEKCPKRANPARLKSNTVRPCRRKPK